MENFECTFKSMVPTQREGHPPSAHEFKCHKHPTTNSLFYRNHWDLALSIPVTWSQTINIMLMCPFTFNSVQCWLNTYYTLKFTNIKPLGNSMVMLISLQFRLHCMEWKTIISTKQLVWHHNGIFQVYAFPSLCYRTPAMTCVTTTTLGLSLTFCLFISF